LRKIDYHDLFDADRLQARQLEPQILFEGIRFEVRRLVKMVSGDVRGVRARRFTAAPAIVVIAGDVVARSGDHSQAALRGFGQSRERATLRDR